MHFFLANNWANLKKIYVHTNYGSDSMKFKKLYRIIILSISLFLFPLNVLAYSEYIIPGGENVGIEINSKGIMVIGFYKVNGKLNKGNPNIKVGDQIVKVGNTEVSSATELVEAIDNNRKNDKVDLTVLRDGKSKNITLDLMLVDGIYKTGLYVKDNVTGIGTLTYIDPSTNIYGALGHQVTQSNTNTTVEVKTGLIFRSYVTSIDRSTDGNPGGKNAKLDYSTKYGNIKLNTEYGIFGEYTDMLPNKQTLKVAQPEEIKEGEAYIYTVLEDETIEKFKINIIKIDKNNEIKNIHFEVVDNDLLKKTGGIVQGMSGSPIIQDDKIIGGVTHVIVSNPTSGIGIFITTMLKEGEK